METFEDDKFTKLMEIEELNEIDFQLMADKEEEKRIFDLFNASY